MRILLALTLAFATAAFGAESPDATKLPFSATSDYKLDIAGSSVQDAMQKLADATGVQIVYGSQDAFGVKTNPISGAMTVDQALSRMLVGTNLTYTLDDFSGRVILRERGVTVPKGKHSTWR